MTLGRKPHNNDDDNNNNNKALGHELDYFNRMYSLLATSCGFLLFTLELGRESQCVICNPYTKEIRVLSSVKLRGNKYISPRRKRNYLAAMGFYCDIDRTSPNLAHYTVVLLYQDGETGISNVKICSSRTEDRSRWRNNYTKINCEFCRSRRYDGYSSDGSYGEYFRDTRTPVGFLNGVFYCTGTVFYPSYDWVEYDRLPCCSLIAYDLNPDKLEETHTTLPVPPRCYDKVIMCVSSNRLVYCALIEGKGNTTDDPKSWIYTLQLCVSKENPIASEKDFGWQIEYSIELDCSVNKLKGFHPRNPRIVFFTTKELSLNGHNYICTYDLKCYDFRKQEVASMGFDSESSELFDSDQPSLLPCERLPWPVSLHR